MIHLGAMSPVVRVFAFAVTVAVGVGVAPGQQAWRPFLDRTLAPGQMVTIFTAPGEGPVALASFLPFVFDGRGWQPLPRLPQVATINAFATDPVSGRRIALLDQGRASYALIDGQWSPQGQTPMSSGARMVFDPARNRLIAWQDELAGTTTTEYVLEGNQWVFLTRNVRPYGVRLLAPDPIRRRLVGFGANLTPRAGQTWEWDGTTWSQLSPSTSPPVDHQMEMSFDPISRQVMLVVIGNTTQTWLWNGSDWHLASATPNMRGTLALDRHRGMLRMLGQELVWDGSNWVTADAVPAAGARYMTEDPIRRVLVVHAQPKVDEYDGRRWIEILNPARPSQFSPLAYDITSLRTVLFDGTYHWSWDGALWNWQSVTHRPARRLQHAFVTHLPSGGAILFGGRTHAGSALSDTWHFASGVWTELTNTLTAAPPAGPCVGSNGPISFHPVIVSAREVWEWNGGWTLRNNAVPVDASSAAITRDGDVVVAGSGSGAVPSWRLRAGQWLEQPALPAAATSLAIEPLEGRLMAIAAGHLLVQIDTPPEEEPLGHGCGPELVGFGRPTLGTGDYSLDVFTVADAPVVFALDTAFTPQGIGGCELGMTAPGFAAIAAADPRGRANLALPIPHDRALRGFVVFAQAAAMQPAGPIAGFAPTPGLRIRIGD